MFSLVYHAGDGSTSSCCSSAHALYASANLLNPMAFGSLKQMEREIIEMAGRLFHGPASASAR